MKKKLILIIILLLDLLLLTQIKFTAWPEMLLWPYLIIKGWFPYKDIAIAHNPLLLVDLTIFYKLFGVGILQLKIYTWALLLSIDLATFWVCKKLLDYKTALYAVLFIIPLQIFYEGNGLWFDLGLTLLFPLIYYFAKEKKYFLVGVVWSLAFLTKQTAIFLLIPIFWEMRHDFKIINIEKLLIGSLSIIFTSLIIIRVLGILPDYLFWAYKFAGGKLPFAEGQIYLPSFKQLAVSSFPFLVSLALFLDKKYSKYSGLIVWAGAAALGAYPRWELFHYLPAVSFLAIIFSVLFVNFRKQNIPSKLVIFFGLTLFLLITLGKINVEWHKQVRFMEPEVTRVAAYLGDKVAKNEKILVLNSWEHFYVLTDTLPSFKPWIPQFSWYMELPNVQNNILSSLITNPPDYVILHPYSLQGLDSYRPKKIADFVDRYYEPVASFENFKILHKRK